MAVAAVGAAQGFKFCGVYLPMVCVGYDRPCCSITIDATAAAAVGQTGSGKKHTATSLRAVRAEQAHFNPFLTTATFTKIVYIAQQLHATAPLVPQ
jgi:hypothetical protein